MIQYLNVFLRYLPVHLCDGVFLGSWLRYDYGQYTGAPPQVRCSINAGW